MGRPAPGTWALIVLAAVWGGACTGTVPADGTRTASPGPTVGGPIGTSPGPFSSGVRFVGAGDIASCTRDADTATAEIVERIGGTVFTTGDNAYERGTPQEFRDCYDPTWGPFRSRTRPVPGNHDYGTPGAAGYFSYFGPRVGAPGNSWYAYDVGPWRAYALDSNCAEAGGCGAGSPQFEWLRTDLERNARRCVVAYWHHPRFSSGRHGDDSRSAPFWDLLYAAGAELVLNGHDHLYERYAPQRPDGSADGERGIRQFTVGTGGDNLYDFHGSRANSEFRENATFGVLELRLAPTGYEWAFHAVGGEVRDSGDTPCH